MSENTPKRPAYEISLSVRLTVHAHSLSNRGNNGSNRTFPRRQLLADGTEVDAISGNLAKHHHAALLAEQFEASGVLLCPACAARNGQRAAALVDQPLTMASILSGCGLCDTHGFLVTAKSAKKTKNAKKDKDSSEDEAEEEGEDRQRLSKHSLIEFSFGLALPEHQTNTPQLYTRSGGNQGAGQMIFKQPSRSAQYGLCVRYKCVGVGVDTDDWTLVVADEAKRLARHQGILRALRDMILSPSGAMTARMLPHLTGVSGAIVTRTNAGRAPLYSPLAEDFTAMLSAMADETCLVETFDSAATFKTVIENLIANSSPHMPAVHPSSVEAATESH